MVMKKLLLIFVASAGLLGAAAAQTTGKTALSLVAKARGVPAGAIVEVSGVRGQDQPASWRVITRDPEFAGRFREYYVRGGKIATVGPLAAEEAPTVAHAGVSPSLVKIDSTQAFQTANEAAKTALVGFDSINYHLRNKEFSNDPIWMVRLVDQRGKQVGEVVISAQTGQVLRRTWHENGRSYANNAEPAPRPAPAKPRATVTRSAAPTTPGRQAAGQQAARPASSSAQEIWENTRNGFNTSKDAVKTGYQKASSVIGGWINRARGDSAADQDSGVYDSSRR